MEEREKWIGLFCARLFEENNIRFIQELQKQSQRENYRIMIFSLDTCVEEDTENVPAELELIRLSQYISLDAGIILAESIKNYVLLEHIARIMHVKEVPCFCIERQIEGCYCLFHTEETGFEPMVRHVIQDHGARKINMLAGLKDNLYSQMRIEQYKKVLAENGIPFEEERLGYGDFWDRPARREMQRFLDSNLPMPDAIVCANDAMAVVACDMLHDAGYRVPEDVIVTGYDGINEGKVYSPVLSTCIPDDVGAASFIFREIHKFIKNKVIIPHSYQIEYRVELNQSCGCCKKSQNDHNKVLGKLNADLDDSVWHTLAMNDLISSVVPLHTVREIAKILPDTEYMWCDHLRYACVKESLIYGKEDGTFQTMTTIMCGSHEEFANTEHTFHIDHWLDEIRSELEDCTFLLLRVLNIQERAFGYTADALEKIDRRATQRCDEFSMFLSNSINMVLQQQKLNELKEHLLQANHELAELSERDAMTGVYNRRGFFIQFNEMLQKTKKKYVVLISIDMNRLKYINDTFGHAEGDFAICSLAKAVERIGTQDGICARFGGDEFDCVFFTDDKAFYTEEKIQKELQNHLDVTDGMQEKEYSVTASVGMAVKEITKDFAIEDLIKTADRLMYQNKKENKRSGADYGRKKTNTKKGNMSI